MEVSEEVYFNLLRRIDFFDTLVDDEIRDILSLSKLFQKYQRGEYIIKEGEQDNALFIILKGKVVVTKRNNPQAQLAILSEGAPFGELAFVSKRARVTDVIAYQGETTVLRIDEAMLAQSSMEAQFKIIKKIIVLLADRLDTMNSKYAKLARQ